MTDYIVTRADESELEHHGVKGQKWGVKKNNHVTLSERPDNLVVKARKKVSKKFRDESNKNHIYDLRNSEGKRIGDLNLYDESKKSMNVVWLGVKGKERGHGYATNAMKQAIDIAKKKKMSQVTLEVPGESPDAHHIYKKLGFKDGKKVSSDDDFWGGLTSMKKDLTHMDQILALYVDGDSIEHHGVKGQKWGVSRYKKARSRAIASTGKLSDARHKQSEAQGMYELAGNKMYKSMAKRDVAKDKAASAKSGSKRQARLVNKSYKYNQKVKDYSKVRTASRNEVLNAKSDAKKAQRTYDDAVRQASKEKVQIKDHTIAKQLLVASINAYTAHTSSKNGLKPINLGEDAFKTKKDDFDNAVMAYRNKVHK